MGKAKHTPGPWTVGPSHVVRVVDTLPPPDGRRRTRFIAECLGATDVDPEANARLIAAAPDLLAIAKRIEAAMDFDATDHPMFDGMQQQLLAAIAKAEGRS